MAFTLNFKFRLKEINSPETYIPGQCNIGPEEVNRRLRIGYIGLGLMVLFIVLAEFYALSPGWKLALFAPTAYALSGFIQARYKFCFLFGFFGLFSMTGKKAKVYDPEQLASDRALAIRIVSQVFIGSAVITLLYFFLS